MTNFTNKVLKIIEGIPRGEVMSYEEVAKAAGKPRACRVVGNVLNKNQNPKIPCHRVIRSDGKIGGYRLGTAKKRALLKKEKAI